MVNTLVVQARSTVLIVAVCVLLLLGLALGFATNASVAGAVWDKAPPTTVAGSVWDKAPPTADGSHWS